LLTALGASVANRNDHSPTVIVINDATGKATGAYGLAPSQRVQIISDTTDGK
jgi:hypothetical protein